MTILDSLVEGALCLGNRREGNELLGMMVRYLATGEEPQPRTDSQRMAIAMVMPVLENSRAKAESGRKGGSSKTASKQGSKTASKPGSKTGSKAASKTGSEEEEEEEVGIRSRPAGGFDENGGGGAFVPPTLDEVRAYFGANCLRGDPAQFLDHYAAQGWMLPSGLPVTDVWALARGWSRRQVGFDADRKAQGRQTSQEVSRAAVWSPAATEEDEAARLDAELARMEGAA